MGETFTCANCGGTFERTWSDEESAAEAAELFPAADLAAPGAGLVCDDCFRAIIGRVQIEAPELLLAGAQSVAGACYLTVGGLPVHVRPACRCPR